MAMPKYMTEGVSKQKKSQKHEARIAEVVGGKTQKGSGSKDFHKGDVKSIELLIENKMTIKDSISVKKSWLVKIFRESSSSGRIPAIALAFEQMPDIVPRDWIAVPAVVFKMLMEYYIAGINEE